MTHPIHRTVPALLLTIAFGILGSSKGLAEPADLPSPAEFEPAKYLGKWFEVARFPTAMQPEGSLATAEYSAGEEDGMVVVKNTAYDAKGDLLRAIEGKAKLAEGDAKGRLKVSFGPALPEEPNYCVLRISKKYQISVVGSPDRKSMWILSRNVPVPKKRLERLAKVAEKAGYDTSKLVFAEWPEKFATAKAGKQAKRNVSELAGNWTFHIEGPDGQVDMPMELKVDGDKLTGRVGRPDDRWLELKNGKVDGDAFTCTVERDRPQGGVMNYAIEGKLADGKLTGKATTGEITSEWNATRVAKEKPDADEK